MVMFTVCEMCEPFATGEPTIELPLAAEIPTELLTRWRENFVNIQPNRATPIPENSHSLLSHSQCIDVHYSLMA
jgi:hypothetical protein